MNSERNEVISETEPLSNRLKNKTIELKHSDIKSTEKKLLAQESRKIFIEPLLAFALEVKSSTSFLYGSKFSGKFRTQRKEQTLLKLINFLKTAQDRNEEIDPIKILGSIVHNAMLVRGSKKSDAETSSGRSAVLLLQKPKFKILKEILAEKIPDLNYKNLQKFSRENFDEEKYFDLTHSEQELKAPPFNPVDMDMIADRDIEEKTLSLRRKSVLIIKRHNLPYQILFFNSNLNIFQRIEISKKSKLNPFLDKIKIGETIIDINIRYKIFTWCAKMGGTQLNQNQLLCNFQNLFYLLNKNRPDLMKIYQLPQAIKEEDLRGICYGLSIAALNSNHIFSDILALACSLEQSSMQEWVETGIISGFEKYPLEDLLFAYKKIYHWQKVKELGIIQNNQYRTSLRAQWVNTLTFVDQSAHLNRILEKILVGSNIWMISLTFSSTSKHSICIRLDQEENFLYYDSNKSTIDWYGPINTIDELAKQISQTYSPSEWTVTANALQPIFRENKFDAHIAALDKIFTEVPEPWINYLIKQYSSDKICQTTFAHTALPLLQNLDPKLKQQLSAEKLLSIAASQSFFYDFADNFPSSSQLISSHLKQIKSQNNQEYVKCLVIFGDSNGVIDLIKLDDRLFAIALSCAIYTKNLALIARIIQHIPTSIKSILNSSFSKFFSKTADTEVAGLLLRTFGIHAKTETDIWGYVALIGAEQKDFDLLNKLKVSSLCEGVKKINERDLSPIQKQQLRARIEQVCFHHLDARYPLTPPTWTSSFTSSTSSAVPSKDSIIASLSTQKKQDHAELLTLLGYGDKISTPTYQGH